MARGVPCCAVASSSAAAWQPVLQPPARANCLRARPTLHARPVACTPRCTAAARCVAQVTKLSKGEVLMLNIGSMCTGARVLAVKGDLAKLQLTSPVCTKEGEKVALSRRVEKHWRLIGWGQIQKGLKMDLPPRS